MKIIGSLFALLLSCIVILYIFLFTSFGNGIVKPLLEDELNRNMEANVKLSKFVLSSSHFECITKLNTNNVITITGNYALFSTRFNLAYRVRIKDLENLTYRSEHQLRGSFYTQGVAEGSLWDFDVKGESNFAKSISTYSLKVLNLEPYSLQSEIQNASIGKILFTLNEPLYGDGILNAHIDIDNLQKNHLDGIIKLEILSAKLNTKYFNDKYDFYSPLAPTPFESTLDVVLQDTNATLSINFDSSLCNLDTTNTQIDLNTYTLKSDYLLNVPQLSKFHFLTNLSLEGGSSFNGTLRKAKDLDLDIHTKISDGLIDGVVHNNEIDLNFTALKYEDIAYMLHYPRFLKSTLNGNLYYDTQTLEGKLKLFLSDARFSKNVVFDEIETFTNENLYAEHFDGNLSASIMQNYLIVSSELNSTNSALRTTESVIDLQNRLVDANISVEVQNFSIPVSIDGNFSHPKIQLDTTRVLTPQNIQEVQNKLKELLKQFF